MDIKTLQYWHRLEHFYPYILTEQNSDYVKMNFINKQDAFPDINNTIIKEGREIACFVVYLGIFKVDSALKVIDERFNYTPKFKDESDEESCFCSFKLTADGLFDKKSFKVSSFPWAIQRVKNEKIDLEQWDEAFKSYQKELLTELVNYNEKIDYDFLLSYRNKISESIDWDIEYSDNWLRIDMMSKDISETSNNREEVELEDEVLEVEELIKINELLNSFYVRDLEKVISSCQLEAVKAESPLYQYLEIAELDRHDVEKDEEILFDIYNPNHQSYVRWPSEYNLRAMQQVAVNVFLSNELLEKNVFSVNGPPGTGKTTLLKDIIAGIIFERARMLSQLKEPDHAFEDKSSQIHYKMKTGVTFTNNVKNLKSEYAHYGILVASNNNTAVQNITLELPDSKSIPQKYISEYGYFNELSDSVLGKDTWGMVAAALGNRKNCNTFINKFWPLIKVGEENGQFDFNKYLRTLKKDSKDQKKINWDEAVSRFNYALSSVEEEYKVIHNVYDKLKEKRKLNKALLMSLAEIETLVRDMSNMEVLLNGMRQEVDSLNEQLIYHKQDIELIENQKPLIKITSKLVLLRNSAVAKKYLILKENQDSDILRITDLKRDLRIKEKELSELQARHTIEQANAETNRMEIKTLKSSIEKFTSNTARRTLENDNIKSCTLPCGNYITGLIGDDAVKREEMQKLVPWNYERLDLLREQLFLESLKLHEAFVKNSDQVHSNLDGFNKMLRGMLSSNDMEMNAAALLQSFFLVVPVVSSTFASIGTFLKYIGKDEIGYLLIDEAGQALPQSAIGAVWRSKKVVAVGDPLQIDPVVTLHDKVIEYLKCYYNQKEIIASKETSVQSLVDYSNPYGSTRKVSEESSIWVGSPILVHGRCRKNIFDISNTIAYSNKMIYDTRDNGHEAICKWIQVKGNSEMGHFVRPQVESIVNIVIETFVETYNNRCDNNLPELFIITPFRSVRAGVAEYFRKNDYLYNLILQQGIQIEKWVVKKWISGNIGTIHTFQGKEAKKVIICLGGDSGGKSAGAIEWACSKPNLLNVAVTRAKNELYIVGDENCWKDKNYFSHAYEKCLKIN